MGQTIVTIKCDNCDKEFNKIKKDIKNKHVFCSRECENEYRHKQTHEIRKCELCKEEFECSKKSTKRLCSIKCQGKWQSTQIGLKNPRFKQEKIKCEWCGEEYFQKQNRIDNGQHNFCSKNCRQEWFAKDYSQRESTKIASQCRAINMLEEGFFDKTDTRCQKIVDEILKDSNINYINEKNYDNRFAVDNYLIDYNLTIEVMGTYWHTDPRKYKTINYDMQVDRIRRDKAKHSYIKNNHNVEILYLWEEDIMNNAKLCEFLIKKYVKNKGILKNYQSFNYIIQNNKLELIKNIIIPYSEYQADKLNNIIDLSVKKQISRKQKDKWITYNCETCRKECEELISHYNTKQYHYCSRECMNKNNQVEVSCKHCGKKFYIQKSVYNKSKTKQFSCSLKCRYKNKIA